MFNLEHAISEWRKRMAASGLKSPAVLDELESHLREEIQKRIVAGDSLAEAFQFAVAHLGSAKSLCTEFKKISRPRSLPVTLGTSLWAALMLFLVFRLVGKVFAGYMDALLCVHIVTLTAGYLATFLAGTFAIYFICSQWRGRLTPGEQSAFDRAIIRFNLLSIGLIAAGFILGSLWVSRNPNAYLPRPSQMQEWVAAIIGVWQVLAWVIQRFSRGKSSWRMAPYICGNLIGAVGWFGPFYLETGFNPHFFMNFWPLQIFVGFHLLVIALAFTRRLETVKS